VSIGALCDPESVFLAALLRAAVVVALSFGLLGFSRVAFAHPIVPLDDAFADRSLGADLEVLVDDTGTRTLEDVSSVELQPRWVSSGRDVPSFGYRSGAVWARVTLADRRSPAAPLFVEFAYAVTDFVDLSDVTSDGVVTFKAGDHRPHGTWPLQERLPVFELAPHAEHTLYVRVAGGSSLQLPLKVFSSASFRDHIRNDTALQALYFGALLALAAYNVIVWARIRLRVYLWYVLFLTSFGVFQATLSGYAYWLLWPSSATVADGALVVSLGISAVSSVAFVIELFDTLRRSFLRKLLRVTQGASVLCAFAGPVFLPNAASIQLLLVPCLVAAGAMIAAGVVAHLGGERLAKWYLIAWSAFLLGTIAMILRSFGVLPTSTWTLHTQQFGSAVEFILLSFVLSDRISILQEQVQAEQAKALAAARDAADAHERALTEERRLRESRDQFIATTSHELRTPLNGMLGLVQAVLRRDASRISEASHRSLDGVVKSGQRLAGLIGDLLDLSRAQRGTFALHKAPTSVARQTDMVLELLQSTLEGGPLRLESLVADDLVVNADPQRVQQILFNLLGNAVKFTKAGTVRVTAQRHDGFVTVSVSDSGPGVAIDAQERIFDPFTQADGGIERRFGGTGLGLAIVKSLVEAHGGKVGVQSVPGFGATFWFSLPVAMATATEALDNVPGSVLGSVVSERIEGLRAQIQHTSVQATGPSPNSAVLPAAKPSLLTILVVDDEATNLQVLGELLSLAGHRVLPASNAQEAFAWLEREIPHLVLLDIMMPGKSGYEVLSEMRTQFNEAELPVLLLTARAQESDLVEGFRRGASDYILKPFSAAEVEARIEHQARLRNALVSTQHAQEEGARLRATLALAEDQLLHAERLASLGAATAGIAHDLGNPLHHVTTTLGWIQERAVQLGPLVLPEAKHNVDDILEFVGLATKGANHALAISAAIRAAVRSDEGVEELFSVDAMVDDGLTILGHRLKRLEVTRTRDSSAWVRGKRSELLQVVLNLLGNAADALSETKDPKVAISVQADTNAVELCVEDSGPGVPSHLAKRIFDPFFTTKASGKGTGLGLAVVSTIAKRWGTQLELSTSPTLHGARFTMRIARTVPEALR
jgi:signal transduction histidine kinase